MLLPFFQWMQGLGISAFFLDTVWPTPIIQVIHLTALGVFSGSVVLVDLRLLGRGLTDMPLAKLAREAEPWFIGAFIVLLITGLPQLTSTAIKQYYSPFFWMKMEAMVIALIFTFTLRRKVTRTDESRLGLYYPKAVALVSLGLWSGVAIGARLIGLFS